MGCISPYAVVVRNFSDGSVFKIIFNVQTSRLLPLAIANKQNRIELLSSVSEVMSEMKKKFSRGKSPVRELHFFKLVFHVSWRYDFNFIGLY